MKKIFKLVGNTPVVKLQNIVDEDMAELYVKLEKYNLSGSAKDRAALAMIEDAEEKGLLNKDSIILEPTSGNTGIALAMIGRLKGYEVCIIMPDNMSKERVELIRAYGAKLILTDGKYGMAGAVDKAYELAKNDKRYFIPQQFKNPANIKIHYTQTAGEIINDFIHLDAFVAGVGTGGTLCGVSKRLKEHYENVKTFAVEPEASAVLSKEAANLHKIQGIGAGFIPEIYDSSVVDEIIKVSDLDAINTVKLVANKEGLLLGISSGASIFAALKVAKMLGKDKKVLAISADGGEKYTSMGIF